MEDNRGKKLQLVTSNGKEIVKWSTDERNSLAQALGQVCSVQRAYGKTAADLPAMVNAFAWAFRKHSAARVVEALGEFILRSSNIPTPHEIMLIIEPPKPTFVPDKSYYYRLQQLMKDGGNFALNDEEVEYCRRYEDHMRRSGT